MKEFVFSAEYFNARDTLDCGQIFRYVPENAGYRVFSADKVCLVTTEGEETRVLCEDVEYFKNYFDVNKDLSLVCSAAESFGVPFLTEAARAGKGVRLLKQDSEEMLFSFIVSQNNNIPRIKGIINRLCEGLGEERTVGDITYRTFPKAADIAQKPVDFYKSIGLGYRAEYMVSVADAVTHGFDLSAAAKLPTSELKRELLTLKGVGPKVADCVLLFGFNRLSCFPVDTWMEKLYREDFGGTLTDRNKITEYFEGLFGENAGYFQQYMFHYKRNFLR